MSFVSPTSNTCPATVGLVTVRRVRQEVTVIEAVSPGHYIPIHFYLASPHSLRVELAVWSTCWLLQLLLQQLSPSHSVVLLPLLLLHWLCPGHSVVATAESMLLPQLLLQQQPSPCLSAE